jgi:hypothetical protein
MRKMKADSLADLVTKAAALQLPPVPHTSERPSVGRYAFHLIMPGFHELLTNGNQPGHLLAKAGEVWHAGDPAPASGGTSSRRGGKCWSSAGCTHPYGSGELVRAQEGELTRGIEPAE